MPKPDAQIPSWVLPLLVGGAVVGVFLWIAIGATNTANEPPRLADVAPTAQPRLLCEPAASTSSATSSPTVSTGAGAAENNSSRPSAATEQLMECSADQAAYAPQYRGSFDPNARYLALLAIVTPLLTTLVAFYFGEKAGAAKGQAEAAGTVKAAKAQNLAERALLIDPNDPVQVQKIQDEIRKT